MTDPNPDVSFDGSAGTFGIPHTAIVDTYIANDTWTKRAGALYVAVRVIAMGGGAGSGRRGAAGTVRQGGCGGGAAGWVFMDFPASLLTSTVALSVNDLTKGTGLGGAAPATDNTDGNDGALGAFAFFGAYLFCEGGVLGVRGTQSTSFASGGTAALGTLVPGSDGGLAALLGGVGTGSSALAGAGGGGAGGGLTSANAASTGTPGGFSRIVPKVSGVGGYGSGNGGGMFGGLIGIDGLDGGAIPGGLLLPGAGGGGGQSQVAGPGGHGGDGGLYGAGGGGGAGALNGNLPGHGGNGAYGRIDVITYF